MWGVAIGVVVWVVGNVVKIVGNVVQTVHIVHVHAVQISETVHVIIA